jgi:multicomponent Na+:H+ antiporter subunit E
LDHSLPEETLSRAHYAFVFTVLLTLWLLLVGSLQPAEVTAGIVVSALVTWVGGSRLTIFAGLRLVPSAPLHLARYLGHFAVALVRSNLDVARRVLSPALPIRPAVVRVRTGLQSSLGRLLLANSITLTPGTLSVDVKDDIILVHWIDCPPGIDLEGATGAIAEGFERHIRGFLR